MKKVKSYDSVWDALADSPEQAANLRARAELMQQIAAIVKKRGWTQVEAGVLVASPSRESMICCAVAYLASHSMRLSTLRLRLVVAFTLNWSRHGHRRVFKTVKETAEGRTVILDANSTSGSD
jgi:Helix-turn-helix domain